MCKWETLPLNCRDASYLSAGPREEGVPASDQGAGEQALQTGAFLQRNRVNAPLVSFADCTTLVNVDNPILRCRLVILGTSMVVCAMLRNHSF